MDQAKEEHAIILDFLPNGYPFDPRPSHRKTPVAQSIGTSRFILRELIPRKDVHLNPGEEVYIGEGKRDKINHIQGRMEFSTLTSTAESQLEFVLRELVKRNEAKFIEFFNKAQPLSTRMHQLELLPGVGKKHMWEVINTRDEEPFKDFADLRARVKLMPDPEKLIVRRIISELSGEEKHLVFVGR